MGYLVGFLKDDALTAVKGSLVTNENYCVPFKMLEKRIDDPQFLIGKHMTTVLSLDTTSSILREVYYEVEIQIRSLEDLGLDPKSYGSLFAPFLMSKLSDELKLLIKVSLKKTCEKLQKL